MECVGFISLQMFFIKPLLSQEHIILLFGVWSLYFPSNTHLIYIKSQIKPDRTRSGKLDWTREAPFLMETFLFSPHGISYFVLYLYLEPRF